VKAQASVIAAVVLVSAILVFLSLLYVEGLGYQQLWTENVKMQQVAQSRYVTSLYLTVGTSSPYHLDVYNDGKTPVNLTGVIVLAVKGSSLSPYEAFSLGEELPPGATLSVDVNVPQGSYVLVVVTSNGYSAEVHT
jgi:archaellum component FlaF (FlaF/FlaG flagellin family)